MKRYRIIITRTNAEGLRFDTIVAEGEDYQWLNYLYQLVRGRAIHGALQGEDELCIVRFEIEAGE